MNSVGDSNVHCYYLTGKDGLILGIGMDIGILILVYIADGLTAETSPYKCVSGVYFCSFTFVIIPILGLIL